MRITTTVLIALGIVTAAWAEKAADPNSIKPVEKKVLEEPASITSDPNDAMGKEAEIEINPMNAMCGAVLNAEYISDSGDVDYALLRRKRSDLYNVTKDFRSLKVEDYLTWDNDVQLAFWINVHNLYTLELIINNYPIEPSRFKLIFYPAQSIMQISGARESNYFGVMGREYSLEEMEDNILELYGDPRVLFALTYASIGSPPMRSEPYNGPMLEDQLDNQVRRFLGRRSGFYIDRSKLYISPIFEWNIDRFVEYYGIDTRYRAHDEETRAIFNFIEQFKGLSWSRILESDKFRLEYQKFDWRLNGK
ncbi:MAG: DUF547 domain-containing protein [Sedimentisphaeraceae bacterium JB056]